LLICILTGINPVKRVVSDEQILNYPKTYCLLAADIPIIS